MQSMRVPKESLTSPEKIIVATDLTDCALLLPFAMAQAQASHAHLTLVYAEVNPRAAMKERVNARSEECSEAKMADLAMSLRNEGLTCNFIVRQGGSVAEALEAEVERIGADRLIMATHGRGRIGQLMLGSVAKSLLRELSIPIFAVGPNVQRPQRYATPKRILHPVSLMGRYIESVELARAIAESYGAELILVHVLGPDSEESVNPRRTVEWAKHALDCSIGDRSTLTVDLRTHVSFGGVVEEVLQSATNFDVDWVLLGLNEKLRNPMLAETTAYRVMASAQCPVLTLPHAQSGGVQTSRRESVPATLG